MNRLNHFSSTDLQFPNVNNWSLLRRRLPVVLLALALGLLALSPTAQAVTPQPDGGYPNANTAEGEDALFSLTTGIQNTAVGNEALQSNTTGNNNTAIGSAALAGNTGDANTAVGALALVSNGPGFGNVANGEEALFNNATGDFNTASGFETLFFNETGSYNTATGAFALGNGSTASPGNFNTASGVGALADNAGDYNTATGQGSLFQNTTGHNNTADGQNALDNNTTGSGNIALGSNAGNKLTTGSNNIDIGSSGAAGESDTIRIGRRGMQRTTYLQGIYGITVAGGVEVRVDPSGHLGTLTSSSRFKEAIKPMDKASETILALEPVTFRYKHDLDPEGIPQFGLLAEQVVKVSPDLVVRDDDGKVNTVRYEAINAMLLNEFLKEHRKVEEQQATITRLESKVAKQELGVAQQQKQIEALTAGLQRVSDRLEVTKATPQLVSTGR